MLKYIGLTFVCPLPDCDFETTAMSAMNNHLRRHTQTFKCGHCGKSYPNSSEFHQHSAMMHGNKIPDQVKDPEADAEFEALKGMVEATCLQNQKRPAQVPETSDAKKPRFITTENYIKTPTARKSTTRQKTFRPSQPKYVARKSTTSVPRPFSIYGCPYQPFDLSSVTTKMSIGGIEMTLNASKMSEIINLKPSLRIKKED